jgi:AraC-like DNA-binding protein
VLSSGRVLADQLELHLYFGNQPIWCLTHKLALYDAQGHIVGLAGISRDLQSPQSNHPAYQKLAAVDLHIRNHFAQPISLAELTAIAGYSVAQLERHCKRVFQLTPRQMIHKARLEEGSRLLLHTDLPITEIALRCGYTDHSAFSRQFRALTRLSPSQYRGSGLGVFGLVLVALGLFQVTRRKGETASSRYRRNGYVLPCFLTGRQRNRCSHM